MDLTPNQLEPTFVDPDQMRRQAETIKTFGSKFAEDRSHRIGEPEELTWPPHPFTTADGVTVDPGQGVKFYEHYQGVVTEKDNSNECFLYSGDLYADRKKALEAALSFWEARRNDATVKIRAICKELGLTG